MFVDPIDQQQQVENSLPIQVPPKRPWDNALIRRLALRALEQCNMQTIMLNFFTEKLSWQIADIDIRQQREAICKLFSHEPGPEYQCQKPRGTFPQRIFILPSP